MRGMELTIIGFILIFIGFMIIFIGTLIYALKQSRGEVKGGGVILIGPIPIVWGTSLKIVLALTIISILILMILAVFLMVGW